MRRDSDPDVEAIMSEQLAAYSPEPTYEDKASWRPATKKHYFRTDPGHRVERIRIPGVNGSYTQDVGREDGKEPTKAFYERRYEKKYSKAERATHEAAIDANNGDPYIHFQLIPNKFEGFLETDSDVLAAYIDSLIASGQLKFVYRDVRTPSTATPQMPAHRAVAALRLQKAEAQETVAAP